MSHIGRTGSETSSGGCCGSPSRLADTEKKDLTHLERSIMENLMLTNNSTTKTTISPVHNNVSSPNQVVANKILNRTNTVGGSGSPVVVSASASNSTANSKFIF